MPAFARLLIARAQALLGEQWCQPPETIAAHAGARFRRVTLHGIQRRGLRPSTTSVQVRLRRRRSTLGLRAGRSGISSMRMGSACGEFRTLARRIYLPGTLGGPTLLFERSHLSMQLTIASTRRPFAR